MHAARIVYEVSIYCSTADKYDQIYLKSANNRALAHLSTLADLCVITLIYINEKYLRNAHHMRITLIFIVNANDVL